MESTSVRNKILYIVVPCYNEEEVLPETSRRLKEKLAALVASGTVSERSRVLFVNDGSRDATWSIIERLHEEGPCFSGLNLSRNRGHQNALLAGLTAACELADVTISMDADLQDDINAVDEMLEKYYGGCDIVYGVRSSRKRDTFFKRATAQGFYKLMRSMGADTVYNHADYRLMSRRAVEAASYRRSASRAMWSTMSAVTALRGKANIRSRRCLPLRSTGSPPSASSPSS